MSQVNLDALIPRDDLFKIIDEGDSQEIPEFKELRIDSDLNPKKAWFFRTLKKPDFQRETSEWKPERIVGLIKSFIDGDIIPSIILWNWKADNFIIDGGHRVSAIISWILDDYGDGTFSKNFFGEANISKEQIKLADKTRELLKDPKYNIGSFSDFEYDFNNPDKVSHERHIRAKRTLINRTLQVQWIKARTSHDAEKSFFRINGEATPINETEAIILKSREKPNAIAARAIIHAGNAHKYWGKYDQEKRTEIEKIATQINNLLFDPEFDPKVVHFPIAGKEYSGQTLELVFGVVNMINGLDEINSRRKDLLKKDASEIMPPKDESGDDTLIYLRKTKRIISIISGSDPYSLGLSPLVYFYSLKGRFQITSFFAMVQLISSWDEQRSNGSDKMVFQKFCAIREHFENFLLSYKGFITEATNNVGGGIKSYRRVANLFSFVIDKLSANVKVESIVDEIKEIPEFGFIKVFDAQNTYDETRNPAGKRPPKETIIAAAVRTFLSAKIICPICNGRATFHSYNVDHILEKRNGGLGDINNLQITHFYCNEEKTDITNLKLKLDLK